MTTRQERDKNKSAQERHQMILTQLLKDEDNKYCVDCDAKGPRWASWNLGIFLCIRCAGIHRNMGVHISKVKSVNLDSWTSEQIAMMQEMGNSRARAVYEANLPDNFRRPQTDSGLEAFIRAKYEHKKYIAHEWIPPQPKVLTYNEDSSKKKKTRSKPTSSVNLNNIPASSGKNTSNTSTEKTETKTSAKSVTKTATPEVDLLGLDEPNPATRTNTATSDPFGDFIGGSSVGENVTGESQADTSSGNTAQDGSTNNTSDDLNLLSENQASQDKQKVTKESILALYGSSGSGTQMFGVPGGMYMSPQQAAQQAVQQPAMQQQQQQQVWAAGAMPNGMMANNAAMMNAQGTVGMMPAPGANLMCAAQQPAVMVGQMPGIVGQPVSAVPVQSVAPAAGVMYGPPQANLNLPQQVQQVQSQMSALNVGAVSLAAVPQQGLVTAGGTASTNWGTPSLGQTLSNNLWQ